MKLIPLRTSLILAAIAGMAFSAIPLEAKPLSKEMLKHCKDPAMARQMVAEMCKDPKVRQAIIEELNKDKSFGSDFFKYRNDHPGSGG